MHSLILFSFLHRFLNPLKLFVPVIGLICVTACGSIERSTANSGSEAQPSTNTNEAASEVYIFATDYQSSGQLYLANVTGDATTLGNTGLSYLGTSAVIRAYDGLLYILHDGYSAVSTDNVQIVDPEANYSTLGQYSTGNGTNPHDIVIADETAFITLYNPTADSDNVDALGHPGDVIAMDTATGEIMNRFSFQDYLADDGDLNANADQMVLVDNILYVALQDLDANTFAASVNGLVGMIDVALREVIGVIELSGRNPMGLAASMDGERLAVANMATYDFSTGNFNTDTPYGGIEIIDLSTLGNITLIADEELGGFVERVEAGGDDFYAVVSNFDGVTFSYSSKIILLPQGVETADSTAIIDDSGTDIREIAINNDVLWISRRQINTESGLSEPELNAVDIVTGAQIGDTLVPAAPGMSMVGN